MGRSQPIPEFRQSPNLQLPFYFKGANMPELFTMSAVCLPPSLFYSFAVPCVVLLPLVVPPLFYLFLFI